MQVYGQEGVAGALDLQVETVGLPAFSVIREMRG
jgi:hypothetical protein